MQECRINETPNNKFVKQFLITASNIFGYFPLLSCLLSVSIIPRCYQKKADWSCLHFLLLPVLRISATAA